MHHDSLSWIETFYINPANRSLGKYSNITTSFHIKCILAAKIFYRTHLSINLRYYTPAIYWQKSRVISMVKYLLLSQDVSERLGIKSSHVTSLFIIWRCFYCVGIRSQKVYNLMWKCSFTVVLSILSTVPFEQVMLKILSPCVAFRICLSVSSSYG